MTPEVQLIEDYKEWFSEFRRTPDVGDQAKLAAGLQAFITDETIPKEPASVPWGGTLVGYAGWEISEGIDPVLRV